MEHSDDEDVPQLSAETFKALQEFYNEQNEKEERLKLGVQDPGNSPVIEEDWQLSQFWYDKKTVETLSAAVLNIVDYKGNIALISCPTLYKTLKETPGDHKVALFEFDTRFAVYGSDFISYDYKHPLDIPRHLAAYFDIVIADPPFLSEECLAKTAVTMKFLGKEKIVLCTGVTMEELADRLLSLKKCEFKPSHTNNLANEFGCFANFNLDSYIVRKAS